MSKFKVGDKVTRKPVGRSEQWKSFCNVWGDGTCTVTAVSSDGDWIQLNNYVLNGDKYPFNAHKFELVEEVETAQISDSWDYAEVARLEQAARDAIKAYNEYVQRMPKKVYLPMYLPD